MCTQYNNRVQFNEIKRHEHIAPKHLPQHFRRVPLWLCSQSQILALTVSQSRTVRHGVCCFGSSDKTWFRCNFLMFFLFLLGLEAWKDMQFRKQMRFKLWPWKLEQWELQPGLWRQQQSRTASWKYTFVADASTFTGARKVAWRGESVLSFLNRVQERTETDSEPCRWLSCYFSWRRCFCMLIKTLRHQTFQPLRPISRWRLCRRTWVLPWSLTLQQFDRTNCARTLVLAV